jgi:transposase
MLALFKSHLETENKWLSYKHMASLLPLLKRQENTLWLKLIHSQVLQQALKNLDNGLNKYLRSRKNKQKVGFPLNTYLPSSKLCSACGNIQAMPLKLRVYKCSSCLVEIDRDLNASKNIRAAGISALKSLWSAERWLTH